MLVQIKPHKTNFSSSHTNFCFKSCRVHTKFSNFPLNHGLFIKSSAHSVQHTNNQQMTVCCRSFEEDRHSRKTWHNPVCVFTVITEIICIFFLFQPNVLHLVSKTSLSILFSFHTNMLHEDILVYTTAHIYFSGYEAPHRNLTQCRTLVNPL